ncbi:hypothetical protein ACLX1H_004487 [Fusarium chlamydosporum]
MAPSPFLSLPWELRHKIYREYFTIDNGYAFQPGPGKLAAFNGKPLDLSLVYTCRFIASETKHMPLALNAISFSTVYHPEWRAWAGRFDYLLRHQEQERCVLLFHLFRFITPEMFSEIEKRFFWFPPVLRESVERNNGLRWPLLNGVSGYWPFCPFLKRLRNPFHGTSPSISSIYSAIDFTLRLLAQGSYSNPELIREIQNAMEHFRIPTGLTGFLDQTFAPWDVPDWDDLDRVGKRLFDDEQWRSVCEWQSQIFNRSKFKARFRFSATSVAIRFLKHLPLDQRLCIRELDILEDGVAVGQQERHSFGLIPFCQENPQLKISLQLSMLKHVFQAVNLESHGSQHDIFGIAHISNNAALARACSGAFETVENWLVEAMALADAGMPEGSFTLTLDGEPCIDLCTDVFQEVILWKVSMQQAADRQFSWLPETAQPDWLSKTVNPYSISAFEHLVNQTSILRSNFHPGKMWNIDKLIADRHEYDRLQWEKDLFEPPRYRVKASAHWLPLRTLLIENYDLYYPPRYRKNRPSRYTGWRD